TLVPRSCREEASGDGRPRVAGEEDIAGNLFADEASIRPVVIEGPDQVVAIWPGVLARAVLVVAVRLGEVDNVHPVSRPALAVSRRCEETLDDALIGIGTLVGEKGVNVFGGRRQAGQVGGDTAQESAAIRLGGRGQLARSEFFENEEVDWCPRPVLWHRR